MEILSWNVNGLRSIYRKGFLNWLNQAKPDILCLQEIRAQKEQIPAPLLTPLNYHTYFNFAEKKGYAGVLVYSKEKPKKVKQKISFKQFDQEGRILELSYSDFILINIYLPHGGRGKEKLGYKLKAYQYLLNYLKKLKNKKVILIGDFNIAHTELDLARPKENQNNTMFTLKEREQINKIVSLGFIDTFRKFHKKGGYYTWWPYFYNARPRNLGWRIDYAFVSKSLTLHLKNAFILSQVPGSDHCPVGIEILGK